MGLVMKGKLTANVYFNFNEDGWRW